jgi:hypothetical protein
MAKLFSETVVIDSILQKLKLSGDGSISTPRSEAEAHITQLRHDKGLIEGSPSGHNVSDLENALTT